MSGSVTQLSSLMDKRSRTLEKQVKTNTTQHSFHLTMYLYYKAARAYGDLQN